MIFVCLGSQVYQFDRLLKELDRLIESGSIKDKVFAQIGASTYMPKHYEYKKFLSSDEFKELQSEATIVISHGGTGALIGALKKEKSVIAVPRLARFGEHTDDHQLQIVTVLEEQGYLRAVYDIENLGAVIEETIEHPIQKRFQSNSQIPQIIEDFIESH